MGRQEVARMGKYRDSRGNQGLLLLAALASIRVAQGLDPEQIELLAAFFEVMGDNLALLALTPGEGQTGPAA